MLRHMLKNIDKKITDRLLAAEPAARAAAEQFSRETGELDVMVAVNPLTGKVIKVASTEAA